MRVREGTPCSGGVVSDGFFRNFLQVAVKAISPKKSPLFSSLAVFPLVCSCACLEKETRRDGGGGARGGDKGEGEGGICVCVRAHLLDIEDSVTEIPNFDTSGAEVDEVHGGADGVLGYDLFTFLVRLYLFEG